MDYTKTVENARTVCERLNEAYDAACLMARLCPDRELRPTLRSLAGDIAGIHNFYAGELVPCLKLVHTLDRLGDAILRTEDDGEGDGT
jgi:hypothetical protein